MNRPGRIAAVAFVLALAAALRVPAQDVGPEAKGGKEFRAFNDTLFTVAYDVFLAARNLKDAFQLAREAVRQRPELIPWRERLARTAEWSGDPQLALREWEYLGGRARKQENWREAIRLSGALRDHVATVRAWEGMASLRELDAAEWGLLIDAYENSGEPGKGVERLRRRLAARPDPALSLKLVELLLRTDRDDEALATLEGMASRYGNTAAIALRRAGIYSRRGRIREAATILDAARGLQASESERGRLLRLQASIYVWMQRYGDAMKAYRDLFASGESNAADLRDLTGLARLRDPDLALRAAVAGWTKFREPDLLAYYLERCIELDRWDLASRVLSRLTPEQWGLFADMPYFYVLAARIHQREGKPALARREYLHALDREPASEDFRSGFLWLLIEQSRLSDLALYADRWGRGPATPQALLEPLAMANKLLQRHREAMAYFRLLDREGERADFPFLLSYAEIQEQAGDGQGAARAYRRALEARLAPPSPGEDRSGRDWQEALARWSWKFGSGDETALRMAALNSSLKGAAGGKEAAFTWRVERGQNPEDAMAALGGAGPGEKAFPAWARLAVAMRAADAGKVADLLADKESGLGAEDKARAAAFLDLRGQAAAYAGESGSGGYVPEPMGLQALRGSPGFGGAFESRSRQFYDERRVGLEGERPLGRSVLLRVEAETRLRPWIAKALDVAVPDREDAGSLELKRVTRHGTTRISAGLRSTEAATRGASPDPAYGFSVEQQWRPLSEAALTAGYESGAVAEENPILALAGLKDSWKANLHLSLPSEIEAEFQVTRAFFRAWDERWLGAGTATRAVAERRLFPALSAGAGFAYNGFAAAEAVPGPAGKPLIGGLLAPREFPQTFWHASVYLEWLDRPRPGASWLPAPNGSVEIGRNYFPATTYAAEGWANELALRGGFALKPSPAQRIIAQAEYARGLKLRNESETGLSLRYACTLR